MNHVYIYASVYIYIYMYACVYVCVRVCMHLYIYIYYNVPDTSNSSCMEQWQMRLDMIATAAAGSAI